MVKHIIVWRLKEYALGNDKLANAKLIKEKLEALNGNIRGLIKLEVGIDFSETESSSDVALYSEFESKEALENYQSNPLHTEIKPFVTEVSVERRMVDYLNNE